MYQQNPISIVASAAFDEASKAILAVGEMEPGRSDDTVSLHRLRSAVVELFTALDETLRDERRSAAECLQRAAEMLGVLGGSAARGSAPPRQGLAPWQLRRVMSHIDANLETPIRNEDLARVAGLSPFHFNVAFRNSVGDSPHQYIIRRRIERAQGLMLSTDSALSDIAAQCGLADQAHLTRLFRKVVGESPAAWRRARETAAMMRRSTGAGRETGAHRSLRRKAATARVVRPRHLSL